MKKLLFLFAIGSFLPLTLLAQYRFDNTVYRTIFLEDLPIELKKQPTALLLDVRSAGEFSDTSQFLGLNIGRMKGAKNINVRELGKRLNELESFKKKPILIICSHSQRSRVAAKMLIDSGFTNVASVNGALSEYIVMRNTSTKGLNDLYETANKYALVSPQNAQKLIDKEKELFILDVRADTVFKGSTKEAALLAFGHLKGAVNIPLSELATAFSKIPENKPLLIIDSYGDESTKAAKMLSEKGYSNISVLFNGLETWVRQSEKEFPKKEKNWIHPKDYGFMSTPEFGKRVAKNNDFLILDIRTKAEFTNSDTGRVFRNRGHIQNAVNIPHTELASRLSEITHFKNKEIVVYGFSTSPEPYAAAHILAENGFTKVKVLVGGLWDVRWDAANLKNMSHLMKLVVDVPEKNQ